MKRILFAALTAAALFSGGILQSLNAQNMEIPKKVSPFPVGDKLPEQFSKYFVGQAWLAPLTDDKRLNAPVSNVTFSPGCRNNWHSHTGGQILIAVGGVGAGAIIRRRAVRPGRCFRATSWRSRPTWSTGTARLPTAGSRIWPSRAIPRPTRIHGSNRSTTRNMRQRRLPSRPRPPAWVKTPDAAWPNCFRAEYRNLGMRTPNYLKFLVILEDFYNHFISKQF